MLAGGVSGYARWLMVLVPCLLGGVEPRVEGIAAVDVTLEDFSGDSVDQFRTWCSDNVVEPVFYASSTSSPISTDPVKGGVRENHPLSPPGSTVATGGQVRVVLAPVPVPDFAKKTAGEFRDWCRDWGMVPQFHTSSGNILLNPPSWETIYANSTKGEVPVGSTVGVILDGPYFLTFSMAIKIALVTLVLAVVITLAVARVLDRRRR